MKLITLTICIFSLLGFSATAQSIQGKWKIFNKHTGQVRSIIEVFKKDQKIYGKVLHIMDPEDQDNLCTECKGKDKNQKIEGLVLVKDFKKDGPEYVDGTITNPSDGRIYDAKLWLDEDNPNILHVRGYIAFFYKTMEWERLNKI